MKYLYKVRDVIIWLHTYDMPHTATAIKERANQAEYIDRNTLKAFIKEKKIWYELEESLGKITYV